MDIKKLHISDDKFDINLLFYRFMKGVNGTNGLSNSNVKDLLELYFSQINICSYQQIVESFQRKLQEKIRKQERVDHINTMLSEIQSLKSFKLFIFSLQLIQIKSVLLEESKLTYTSHIAKLQGLHPLSLQYDNISKNKPYYQRISAALFSLRFFSKLEAKNTQFISHHTVEYIESLVDFYQELALDGLEANQIFMLMFSESVNQSIISSSGISYEYRIQLLLESLGIPKEHITKKHDSNDSSTEFDFFFILEDKKYGIGAKRTLRERYKQFIKTAQMSQLDVMIEITLGIDLSEEKAKSIRNHDVYLFVAEEVYTNSPFMHKIDGLFSAKDLTLDTLVSIGKTE
ncbi:hypothetical protein [Candidatus Albibeggiatoa sp. nov. NOAA]|uniref:hypothetical protein n=1 Tax=Candidatus Albibeggiatoa sp. nov. NOAA TaxID=3162724 RepID=UPI00330532BD|nr:type II restriction endonuclease [Thiotrichaceae bacterium]